MSRLFVMLMVMGASLAFADESPKTVPYTAPKPFASTITPELTISGGRSKPLMIFKSDGTVWANPELKPDETARKVLEILTQMRVLPTCAPVHITTPSASASK